MFCQLFGKYLLEKNAINEFDYRTLIDEQMGVRVRLGTIAVADGLLTEEQVEKINRLQMTRDKRFGDIAVEQGLITDEQLGALLKKQGDPYLQFVQLLTDLTDISVFTPDGEEEIYVWDAEGGEGDYDLGVRTDVFRNYKMFYNLI